MKSKYSLTAIAVATMAVGASGSALAKKPGNPGPDPAFPTVKDLSCIANCSDPFWRTSWGGEFMDDYFAWGAEFMGEYLDGEYFDAEGQPAVCNRHGEYFAEATWLDTIGEGMAEGARYAGGLEVEVLFEARCGFDWQGESTEGYCAEFPAECYFDGEGLVAARQFDYELDLSAAEMFCAEGYCSAMWDGEGLLDGEGFYDAYSAAHIMACEDEGGTTMAGAWVCGEYEAETCVDWDRYEVPWDHPDAEGMMMGRSPGFEDFEVSLKHIAPGKGSGRQDHPVVTADCYDNSMSGFMEELLEDLDGEFGKPPPPE